MQREQSAEREGTKSREQKEIRVQKIESREQKAERGLEQRAERKQGKQRD